MKYILTVIAAVFTLTACHTTNCETKCDTKHAHKAGGKDKCCAKVADACCKKH
jgi:hypothetical protein